MKAAFLTLMLVGGMFSLFGSVAEDVQAAGRYFEAEDYSHAKMLYEGLLDERISSWERQIIKYNIATVLLAQGKWEEASIRFEELSGQGSALPLLNQKVLSNLALARMEQVKERFANLEKDPHTSYSDYNQTYSLFHVVLSDVDRAHAAWCQLQSAEGAATCPESVVLQDMQLEVKNLQNQFFHDYLNFRLDHASVQEGVSSLIFAENSLTSQLKVFQEGALHESYQKKYLEDYMFQAESWKPLWDKLESIFKGSSKAGHSDMEKQAFDSAYHSFLESLSLAGRGSFNESVKQLDASKQSLDRLLHQYFSNSSLKDILQQLQITYGLALIKDPLQEGYLEQILETQTAMEASIQKFGLLSLSEEYVKAQKYLKSSIDALNDFQTAKGRFFAEAAGFYVKEMAEQVDFTPKIKSAAVLENAIAKQELILLLGQLKEQVPKDDKDLANADGLMSELQEAVLQTAVQFPAAVVAQQTIAFSSAKTEKERCQCHPWDEVIPLFSQGYANAELAHQRLLSGSIKPAAVQHLQKIAVDAWKEALAKMRNTKARPLQQEQKPSDASSQQAKTEQDQSAGKGQEPKFNEILRTVQDMENDDRSKPQQVKTSGSKGVERPW